MGRTGAGTRRAGRGTRRAGAATSTTRGTRTAAEEATAAMRSVGSAMAERRVPPSVSWTRMRSPRWVAGGERTRGCANRDRAEPPARRHTIVRTTPPPRARTRTSIRTPTGRIEETTPRCRRSSGGCVGSGLAGDGDARSRGAVAVGDALVTMMLLQRDSSAATRAARSDGSRAVVLRGALFRERRMGRTGDSRAHVEVPLRRNLVDGERLHVSRGVQHLGRPRAEIQGHHLRLVPHAVVGPEQLREKWEGFGTETMREAQREGRAKQTRR